MFRGAVRSIAASFGGGGRTLGPARVGGCGAHPFKRGVLPVGRLPMMGTVPVPPTGGQNN